MTSFVRSSEEHPGDSMAGGDPRRSRPGPGCVRRRCRRRRRVGCACRRRRGGRRRLHSSACRGTTTRKSAGRCVGRAGIKAAIEAGGGTYISNDAKSSEEQQASNVENLISQGANVLIILAQDTERSAIGGQRHRPGRPGHRLRPPDRGPDGALHHVRQRPGRRDAGRSGPRAVSEGNFVIIKGNGADANSDFLRQGTSTRASRRWRDQRHDHDRRRDLHRQLGSGARPDRDGAVPDRERQRGRRRAVGERRHGRRRRRRSRPRASPARSRSPARTATWRPSTASRWARRPWPSGRTPASSGGPPARPRALCENPDITAVEGTAPVRARPGATR